MLPVFGKHPVIRAYLFGSQARGEQSVSSDADVFREIDRAESFDLFAYGPLARDLQVALGLPVDVVKVDDLDLTNPRLYREIERDKVMLYKRTAER